MIKYHSIKRIFRVLVFVGCFILISGWGVSETYKDSPKTVVAENESAIVYCEYCDPLENVLPADGFNMRPLMGEYNGRSDSDWTITANFSDSETNCPNPNHPKDVPYCEHTGQDWALIGASALRANIYAEANGTVVAKGYNGGFGNYVLIRHNDLLSENENEIAIWSQYAHLDSSIISDGDQVYRGQIIGYVGNTGSGSFGAHLHWEVRVSDFSATIWPYSDFTDFPKHNSLNFCEVARNYLINMGYRVPNAFVAEKLFSSRSNAVTDLMAQYQGRSIIDNQFNRYYIERRAYFIDILVRALEVLAGKTLEEADDPYFNDIDELDVGLKSAIRKALRLGIINLAADLKFRPLDPIKRIEALAFIVRTFEAYKGEIEFQEAPYFDDIQIVSETNAERWIWETAQKGREAMLVSGYVVDENRYMCPLRWTTREEAVILVNNLISHLNGKEVPVINWFRINNGSPTAISWDVTLNNNVTGVVEGTEYMASENADFEGAAWLPYNSAPTFSVNPVDGVKTIYFKVRNGNDVESESEVAIDSIIIVLNDIIPVVTRFEIDNGVENTTDHRVTLNNDTTGTPTQYLASLNSQFRRNVWKNYSKAPIFTIPLGYGSKRIYFKVRNSTGVESQVVSDVIKLSQTDSPFITRLKINNGAEITKDLTVRLNNTATRNPKEYMASEDPEFDGAEWKKYTHTPTFTLSGGNGLKEVFFKVKNADGEAAPASDTIMLDMDETPNIVLFLINNGVRSTKNRTITLNNETTGSPTHYKISEDPNFINSVWKKYSKGPKFKLSNSKGLKTLYFKVKRKKAESDLKTDTIILR